MYAKGKQIPDAVRLLARGYEPQEPPPPPGRTAGVWLRSWVNL